MLLTESVLNHLTHIHPEVVHQDLAKSLHAQKILSPSADIPQSLKQHLLSNPPTTNHQYPSVLMLQVGHLIPEESLTIVPHPSIMPYSLLDTLDHLIG